VPLLSLPPKPSNAAGRYGGYTEDRQLSLAWFYKQGETLVKRLAPLAAVAALALSLSFGPLGAQAKPADPSISNRPATSLTVLKPQLDPSNPQVNAQRLVALPAANATPAAISRALSRHGKADVAQNSALVTVDLRSGVDGQAAAEQLAASGLFRAIDFAGKHQLTDFSNSPNDPWFINNPASYNVKQFPGARFNEVWADLNNAAPGETFPVAVLDTGFDFAHQDTSPNILPGWNYEEQTADLTDNFGHGTGTAGLIGAASDNGIGITGAAWDTEVVAYKLSDSGWLEDSVIAEAIAGAARDGARIISMSFGGGGMPSYWKPVIDEAISHGVILIASAGNEGDGDVSYPAAYRPVLSVGGTNNAGKYTGWATANAGVDIAGPAEDVALMTPGDGYEAGSGTSFSCPLVAAGAALVWRFNPDLTAQQVQDILLTTAHDITAAPARPGWDKYTGAGVLDVRAAVDAGLAAPVVGHINPSTTYVSTPAGQAFSLALPLVGDQNAVLQLTSGTLPAGVQLAKNAAGVWELSGTPTTAGIFELPIAPVGGQPVAVQLIVNAGPVDHITVTANTAAAFNDQAVEWTIQALDAFGNNDPELAEQANVTTAPADCQFPTGAAPAFRVCTITADLLTGQSLLSASTTVDLFDRTGLTPPLYLDGKLAAAEQNVAVIPTEFSTSAPVNWPNVTWQWFVSGKPVSSNAKLSTANLSAGDAVWVVATVNHKGLTFRQASRSIRLTAPASAASPSATAPTSVPKAKATVTVKRTAKGVKVTVTAPLTKPTGKIRLSYLGKTVTKTLKNSTVSFTLKGLSKTKRTTVTATYLGSSKVTTAKRTIKISGK
jgi:hypothetical protein